jgi:hypothetical protein
MATVLFAALVIFAYGIISLVTDLDVIDIQDAGPLIGPLMVTVACAVVFACVIRHRPRMIGRIVVAGLATAVLPPLVGSVVYLLSRGEPAVFPVALGRFLIGPFVPVSAVIAAIVVLSAELVVRATGTVGEPPRTI